MAGLTTIYQDDSLRIYWHEEQRYYLSDWQPVFRKGEPLKRAYQASVVPEREVGKMSAFKAVERAQVVGALTISVHKTRAEAEAAIRDWHEKHSSD